MELVFPFDVKTRWSCTLHKYTAQKQTALQKCSNFIWSFWFEFGCHTCRSSH